MNNIIEKIKNKKVLLTIIVILISLIVIGGTYALLTAAFNGINDDYTAAVECFKVNYSIDNDDGTQNIEGTLFPSAGPSKGLSGKVSISMDQSCNVSGTGTLKLHIDDTTSNLLTQVVDEHCENPSTLETFDNYDSFKSCVSNGNNWVTEGTGLKYAIYDNDAATGEPLNKGYIRTDDIGTDMIIYDNFNVLSRQLNLYVFIWLDGYITDNSYVNQPISGYIHASVVQNEFGVIPSAPVLDESGMIPVIIDNLGNAVTTSEDNPNWYNYGEKKWANAVLVNESSRDSYLNNPGALVTKSDILAYYVWVPRYSYKMNSTSGAGNESEISISFDYNEEGYTPHPAFKFGNEYIYGFWTGKFETTGTAEEPTVLDGVSPLVSQTASEQFISSLLFSDGKLNTSSGMVTFAGSQLYGLSVDTDSHMMKNNEWGAVAYLSHSEYGTCTNGVCNEVRYNNYYNSGMQTGCGADPVDTKTTSSTCTLAYGSGISEYSQSTNGNITGIFDMAGGAVEQVMSVFGNKSYIWVPSSSSNSGFSGLRLTYMGSSTSYSGEPYSGIARPIPAIKYYDHYMNSNNGYNVTITTLCNGGICYGHGLSETSGWYSDTSTNASYWSPWFVRGDSYPSGVTAGLFSYNTDAGVGSTTKTFRSVIIPKAASVGVDDSSSSEIVVTLDYTDGYGWDERYDWIDNSGNLSKNFSPGDTYGDLPIPDGDNIVEFIGWYTEPDGGTLVTSDMQLVSDEDHTLYAHWDSIIVTLDASADEGWFDSLDNGWNATDDSYTMAEHSFIAGSTYEYLPEPYHDYMNFFGWYTDGPCSGTNVTADMQLISDEDHTLYACFRDWAAD